MNKGFGNLFHSYQLLYFITSYTDNIYIKNKVRVGV